MLPDEAAASGAATSGAAGVSTAEIWSRRTRGSHTVAFATSLTGISASKLNNFVSVSLAASDEASRLLDDMESLFRTMATTIGTQSERCVNSIRGPVLWAETITARANALGNDDVFVCGTSSRSFDTVENRVLAAALESIAKAEKVLRGPGRDDVALPDDVCERALRSAMLAKKWRNGPRLAEVSTRRLSGREMAHLKGSRRLARMSAVVAVRDRQAEPFEPSHIVEMSDSWTREFHDFVVSTVAELSKHMRLPHKLTCFEGAIWAGPVSFRHPAAAGGAPVGLALRGIPLLPPSSVTEGSPWEGELPAGGILVTSKRDVERIAGRVGKLAAVGGPQRLL